MAAGDRDADLAADRLAAFENLADDVQRQHVDRHADQCQREQRRRALGIDIGNRPGGRDAAEVEGVVDDRRVEISRRDDRLLLVDLVNRGIVAAPRADQQLRRNHAGSEAGEDLLENRRGDLGAAAAAVRKMGQPG